MAALGIPGLIRWIAGGLVVLILIGAGVAYVMIRPYAQIGASYIAKQMCSCLFVAGRSEASCHAEFEPDIERFQVTVHRGKRPGHDSVRTRMVIFSGAAKYNEGYGCTVAK
jgi:hypothetical protein